VTICPTCGDVCAQAWCGFCERALPHPDSPFPQLREPPRNCAFQQCRDPDCYWCVGMKLKFHVEACGQPVEAGKRGTMPCRLERGHHGVCKPSTKRRPVEETEEDAWWS
jgi:hypothetical protein